MEVEEPNFCVPLPSPHPSAELLDSLDLTPERKQTTRRSRRRGKAGTAAGRGRSLSVAVRGESATTQSVAHHRLPLSLPNAAPSQLAAHHLNSTAQLYNKIQNLKQQRKQTNIPGSQGSKTQHTHSQPSMSTEDSRTVTDLESLYKGQKPLKEVNVPRHTTRYSNLVSVTVSEESFQEMAVKPRKNEYLEPWKASSQEEPNIMDFYSPDCEEALWTMDSSPCITLEHTDVPDDAPFTLYRFMQYQ